MAIDPLAQEIAAIGIGLAAGMSAILKFLPAFMTALRSQKHEGNGKFTEYQRLQVIEIVRVTAEETRLANESALVDLRNLITKRTEDIREVIREEIGREKNRFVRSEHPEPYDGPERRRE